MTTVALAGRRIDPPDAPHARFPLVNVAEVERRLGEYFHTYAIRHLVCSAACGADLLALLAAQKAGIAAPTIVLPFNPERFRQSSVTDRPGDWGELYDVMIANARKAGRLVVLAADSSDDRSYKVATSQIVAEAAAAGPDVRVCLVWEGAARGVSDHSTILADAAKTLGWPMDFISTL